jgi:hypothetical protein
VTVIEGVDYAWERPTVAGLVAAGKKFVVRYGGPGSAGKQLDAGEARALIAAGVAIVANAEGAADGLLGGRPAGIAWARSAEAHFRALGMPADRPIYLSVDWDMTSAQWPQVADALRGAASEIGASRVGVYGGRRAIEWARRDRVAAWFWQTYGWSGGVWVSGNHLQQYRNHVSFAGGTVDLCRAMVTDYGQWGQGGDDDMTPDESRMLRNADRIGSALIGGQTEVTEVEWPAGVKRTYPLAIAAQAKSAAEDAKAARTAAEGALALVRDLAARPAPGAITDEQLERVLRKILGMAPAS